MNTKLCGSIKKKKIRSIVAFRQKKNKHGLESVHSEAGVHGTIFSVAFLHKERCYYVIS